VIVEAVAAPGGTSPEKKDVFYVGNYSIQVGAFKDPANAERLVDGLSAVYHDVHTVKADVAGETFYRVRVGKSGNLDKAREFVRVVRKKGYPQAFIISE